MASVRRRARGGSREHLPPGGPVVVVDRTPVIEAVRNPLLSKASATAHDSPTSSHRPDPDARMTNRQRSASRTSPSSPGTMWTGEAKQRSPQRPGSPRLAAGRHRGDGAVCAEAVDDRPAVVRKRRGVRAGSSPSSGVHVDGPAQVAPRRREVALVPRKAGLDGGDVHERDSSARPPCRPAPPRSPWSPTPGPRRPTSRSAP